MSVESKVKLNVNAIRKTDMYKADKRFRKQIDSIEGKEVYAFGSERDYVSVSGVDRMIHLSFINKVVDRRGTDDIGSDIIRIDFANLFRADEACNICKKINRLDIVEHFKIINYKKFNEYLLDIIKSYTQVRDVFEFLERYSNMFSMFPDGRWFYIEDKRVVMDLDHMWLDDLSFGEEFKRLIKGALDDLCNNGTAWVGPSGVYYLEK